MFVNAMNTEQKSGHQQRMQSQSELNAIFDFLI